MWKTNQQILIALVDELHETQTCSDELWKKLTDHYQTDQIIELIMLTGLYHAVSFVVNSLQIENEWFAG